MSADTPRLDGDSDIAHAASMRLHWSPRSPFTRKVVIAAHEKGVFERIRLMRSPAAMDDVNPILSADNPLNKLPTLVLADGRVLFDSLVICLYLDGLSDASPLLPTTAAERLWVLRQHALANGLLDLLTLWRNERNRPAAYQSPPHLAAFEAKTLRCLKVLNNEVIALARLPYGLAHITLGCALDYMSFRFPQLDWRSRGEHLAAWHAGFAARPSSLATIIRDVETETT